MQKGGHNFEIYMFRLVQNSYTVSTVILSTEAAVRKCSSK